MKILLLLLTTISFSSFAKIHIENGNYQLMPFMSSGNCPSQIEISNEENRILLTKQGEATPFEEYINQNTQIQSRSIDENNDQCFFEQYSSNDAWILKFYNIDNCESTNPFEGYFLKKVFAQKNYFFIESLDNKDWFVYSCHYTR